MWKKILKKKDRSVSWGQLPFNMTSWINTPTRKAEGIHVFLLDINGHKSRRGNHGLIKTGIVTVKARELEGAAMRCGPSDLNSWWDPSEVPTADSQRNNNTIPMVQLFLIRRWWCRGICVTEDVKGAKSLKNISSSINLWVFFSGCREKMWKIVAVNGRVTWTVGSKFLSFI